MQFRLFRRFPHLRPAFAALGTLALVAIASSIAAPTAHAQFSGYYDPTNWTLTNTIDTDGSINTTAAPGAITLTGGNNSSIGPGTTAYSILSAGNGNVSFNWNYATPDSNAFFDPFVFRINGIERFRFNQGASVKTGSGALTFSVLSNDKIEFDIETIDNTMGAGNVTISNFSAPAAPSAPSVAPEPGSLALLGSAALGSIGVLTKKRRGKKDRDTTIR
jgi:hypothetical protein